MSLLSEVIMFRLQNKTCEHMSNFFIGRALVMSKKKKKKEFECSFYGCNLSIYIDKNGKWDFGQTFPF